MSGRAGFLHGLLLLRGVVAAAEDNAAATDAAHPETDAETAAGAEAAHLARVSVARQLDDAIDAVASRLLASSLAYGRRHGVVWGPARRSCAATRIRNIVLLKGDGLEPLCAAHVSALNVSATEYRSTDTLVL